jgi:hypothetical protein
MDMTAASAIVLAASVGKRVRVNVNFQLKDGDDTQFHYGPKVASLGAQVLPVVATMLGLKVDVLRTPNAFRVAGEGDVFTFSSPNGVEDSGLPGYFDVEANFTITGKTRPE